MWLLFDWTEIMNACEYKQVIVAQIYLLVYWLLIFFRTGYLCSD